MFIASQVGGKRNPKAYLGYLPRINLTFYAGWPGRSSANNTFKSRGIQDMNEHQDMALQQNLRAIVDCVGCFGLIGLCESKGSD